MLSHLKTVSRRTSVANQNTRFAAEVVVANVRSSAEFVQGQAKGGLNTPLQALDGALESLLDSPSIVFRCASGSRRSIGMAKAENSGPNANNGGPRIHVERMLKECQ
jgi:rhodanese-related sulfurtransferase